MMSGAYRPPSSQPHVQIESMCAVWCDPARELNPLSPVWIDLLQASWAVSCRAWPLVLGQLLLAVPWIA